MDRRTILTVVTLLTLAAVLALPSATFAGARGDELPPHFVDKGVPNSGDSIAALTPPTLPEAAKRNKEDKEKLAQQYQQVLHGELDAQAFEAEYDAFLKKNNLKKPPTTKEKSSNAQATLADLQSVGTDAVTPQGHLIPQSGFVQLSQVPQSKYYYCGPSAAYSMLGALGYWRSNDGEVLSQANLATQKYLETETYTGTPWTTAGRPMPESLNYWMTSNYYAGWYNAVDGDYNYKENMTTGIGLGWAVALNTVEYPGTSNYHFQGHPTDRYIYHWGSVYGYTNYGNSNRYADPAAGSSTVNWPGTQAYYSYSITQITTMIRDRGYVW